MDCLGTVTATAVRIFRRMLVIYLGHAALESTTILSAGVISAVLTDLEKNETGIQARIAVADQPAFIFHYPCRLRVRAVL